MLIPFFFLKFCLNQLEFPVPAILIPSCIRAISKTNDKTFLDLILKRLAGEREKKKLSSCFLKLKNFEIKNLVLHYI